MSTVKISQLPLISTLNANTSNSLFMGVDLPTGTTGKFTAHTLAQGLYSNEILNVGLNQQNLPNTIAQFALAGESYIQTNLVNTNDGGTADIVVTANVGSGGTDSTNFIDMGWANKNYQPGLEYNDIGNAIYPNDGYLYAQGTPGQPNGNLIVGTTTSGSQLKFIVGGGSYSNIVAKMTSTGLVLNTQSSLTFSDGSIQSTAAATLAYTQAAFATANTANALNQIQIGIDITQNAAITAVNQFAQSAYNSANTNANNISYQTGVDVTQNAATALAAANTVYLQGALNTANASIVTNATTAQNAYNKANNALANTSGTFAGDLTITGNTIAQALNTANLIVNGTGNISGTLNVSGIVLLNAQVVLTNTSFSNTQAALTIAATPTVATPSQDGYMLHISGKQNVSSRIVTDSFGANTYVVYAGRSARGNVTNPSAVQTNDILSRFSGNGYGTTKYQPFGTARIDFVAAENYTDSTTGSQIQFWNCPVGTNTLTQIATFNGTSVTFAGSVQPQKGFIYTPTVYPGAQTAITIDFANNSLIRAQTASGLVATLSNLISGKEVVAWITNTSSFSQTFTHGLSSTNSTVNATTYSMPGTSTILARYMSIDGTAQNTFVSITHA
jgi:hypothetical protein